jgi:hypothetical protein
MAKTFEAVRKATGKGIAFDPNAAWPEPRT